MRPLVAPVVTLLVAGCTSLLTPLPSGPGGPVASPTPTDVPSTPITAAYLAGSWVYGSGSEPSPGPVMACYPSKLWLLQQHGNQVTGEVNACVGPCAFEREPVSGTDDAGHLTLAGTSQTVPDQSPRPVSYDLRFDPTSQHLVGTRNGAAYWAAPWIQPRAGCGPAPM